ncbi:MAG: hypothetical protein ACC726_16885 [Chloroflexota bacterium]
MADPPAPRSPHEASALGSALTAAGLVYLGLGATLAIVYVVGGVQSSLFPTGWLFPAVLLLSGGLMAKRLRFDLVMTLWGGLTLAVFLLATLLFVDALDLGFEDVAAFDSTLIVAALGLVPLLLRPQFRS